MSEPEWMKSIRSSTVCNYFYVIFIFTAVVAVASLLMMLFVLPFLGLPKGALIGQTLSTSLVLALSVANALFLYIMCDRSLLQ